MLPDPRLISYSKNNHRLPEFLDSLLSAHLDRLSNSLVNLEDEISRTEQFLNGLKETTKTRRARTRGGHYRFGTGGNTNSSNDR